MSISVEGGRVLGCLVEKQLTTPQQYPLTLNALSAACNQTTNRQPVMALDDLTIQRALDDLKALGLVRFVLPSHGKSVTRYRHVLDDVHGLDAQQIALLAVLLLRGPQTPGELRARTERMAEFDSTGAVHHQLEALAGRPQPLAQLLQRRPGQKEDRWRQLLATESSPPGSADGGDSAPGRPGAEAEASLLGEPGEHGSPAGPPDDAAHRTGLAQRIESLEARLAELSDQVAALNDSLGRLRRNLGESESGYDDPHLGQDTPPASQR